VTHDDATLPGNVDGAPGPEARARFDAAIRAVSELAMALSSALSAVAFGDALALSGKVGEALSRAADLAALPGPAERAAAVQQLVAMRGVVSRLLQNAPAPSETAIAAANAGDRTALDHEARAWIADRLASGTNPRGRVRRDTQPESPKAWSMTRDADPDAMDGSADAALDQPPSANEDNAR
jgi:hypothetical protein